MQNQETTLKDIVDKNFKIQIKKELQSPHDLVNNFHWIIMRARRSKHITREQLAEAIAEPEKAIIMAERGILPEDYYKFLTKIENYLSIKLIKKEFAEKIEEKPKEIRFDAMTTKNLTISDLQEMKRKREVELLKRNIEIHGEGIEKIENNIKDLSQDKDDSIFE